MTTGWNQLVPKQYGLEFLNHLRQPPRLPVSKSIVEVAQLAEEFPYELNDWSCAVQYVLPVPGEPGTRYRLRLATGSFMITEVNTNLLT